MNTFTDEELIEYLEENELYNNDAPLDLNAFYNGFSYDTEKEGWVPL